MQPLQRSSRRRLTAVVVVFIAILALWLGIRGFMAYGRLSALEVTAGRIRTDAKSLDFKALSVDLQDLRDQAHSARGLTSDPIWGLATHIPVLGTDAAAARQTAAVLDDLAIATQPLAAVLPGLQPSDLKTSTGSINIAALQGIGPAVMRVSTAVDEARAALAQVDTGVVGKLTRGITQLKDALNKVHGPLEGAGPVLSALPAMLGANGQRTWFVGLENLAEARGTGGFLGAYAVVTTDRGAIKLSQAAATNAVLLHARIPTASLPSGLLTMWGCPGTFCDLAQWNGLNLSPHFPYTGSLVVDGWKARGGGPVDGVLFIDQPAVAALLTGTGPVTVRGVTISSSNAEKFLTTDLYVRFPKVADKDAVVVELMRTVFGKLSAGHFNVVDMLKALRAPASNGGVLTYSAHLDEEKALAGVSIGGVLPDTPGPTATAVINNGSGNKMERYLKVGVDYVQGDCAGPVRTGDITVTLINTAPTSGLPSYVTARGDLNAAGKPVGSTLELLDVYGPVGSAAVVVSLDGQTADFSVGVDRLHPTWRVDVELNPGQTRTVEVQFLQQLDPGTANGYPMVLAQPMVNPQAIRVEPGSACHL